MDRKNVDIVLIRMDKIGDLVLSLPVDEHPALSGANVHWFVSKGMGFIPAHAEPVRAFSEFKRSFSPVEFRRMVQCLRGLRPRTVVLLHNPWWVSCAAWWAGVPERSGRRSQWHSWLFLNLPLRQKRSVSDRHESDFNFDLVEWSFARLGRRRSEKLDLVKRNHLSLRVPHPDLTLKSKGLAGFEYRVVHPGMAGSALNWPVSHYHELIATLAAEGMVVITGTKMDQRFLEGLKDLKDHHRVKWLVEDLSTLELLDVLARAKSVVAPSTGVLHLAASLGTPTLGIYSPRQVEHPRRWGPKGPRVQFVVAPLDEGKEASEEVMGKISPAQIHQSLLRLEAEDDRSRA